MAHGITKDDSMFSVREMPWHGLGVVLDEYPSSIQEAIEKAGLEWSVKQGDLQVVTAPEWTDDFGKKHPAELQPVKGWRANIRQDNGEVLGIVTDEYEVVQNREAFSFLDALLMDDLHFETAGSLQGGRRVWVLAKVPDHVEMGGDATESYIYVANSHDASMAVTAAPTNVRVVCANTLGMALRQSDHGAQAARTFRFRHTGNLDVKFEEARKVMGLTMNYQRAMKQVADELAQKRITPKRLESKVLRPLVELDVEGLGDIAKRNRQEQVGRILATFKGNGPAGDTTGNSPGTKWAAFNACAEWAEWGRRYSKRTNQVSRSFEDQRYQQRALDLVVSA